MILSIWDKVKGVSDDFYDFVMSHYDEPLFWIIIFGVLLLIAYFAISKFADK